MPAIITNKFRVHNAEQFKESFGEAADTYYLGIGRPQAFVDNQAFNDGTDTNPPTPNDDIGSEFYNYDDMLSAKKIASTDVLLQYLEETGQQVQYTITTDTTTETSTQLALR